MLNALRTYLLSDPTLSGLIGTRLHPLTLPQGSTFPAISYQVVTNSHFHTLGGPVDLERPRIQFDVYATTYMVMDAVAEALRTALDAASGQLGGSPGIMVQGAFLDMQRDVYESDPQLYRRTMDFFLWLA